MIPQRVKSSVRSSSFFERYFRVSLVFWYLFSCLRYRTIPWNFFQLNGAYFSKRKGIFSKLEMDKHIPQRWRLKQYYYKPHKSPGSYPVFLKPEWGQNSNGIVRVYNKEEYRDFQRVADTTDLPFIVQDAASGKKEFEIYYLRSPDNDDEYSFLSITQVNNSCGESYPINSIYNSSTRYIDKTRLFSADELKIIWKFFSQVGRFRMARIGLKADNINDLLKGEFHIIEINLFLPMPLVLLTENVGRDEKKRILRFTMSLAARLVKEIPSAETGQRIFFRKMKAHYKIV